MDGNTFSSIQDFAGGTANLDFFVVLSAKSMKRVCRSISKLVDLWRVAPGADVQVVSAEDRTHRRQSGLAARRYRGKKSDRNSVGADQSTPHRISQVWSLLRCTTR